MNLSVKCNSGRSHWYAAGVALYLAAAPADLAAADAEPGFVVRTAFTDLVDGAYHLYADIDYGLGERALEALENGVPLTFEVQVLVLRLRRFMWNETVADLTQQYQLVYHPLAERFVLRNLNSGSQGVYMSFRAAATELGQISGLPVIEESRLAEGEHYQVRMRVRLVFENFPDPLRWVAWVFPRWRVVSDWYAWTLRS